MALKAKTNGIEAENLVKKSLISIGCYVDERERYYADYIKIRQSGCIELSQHFLKFPFNFSSQKGLRKKWNENGVYKIPDFKSEDFIIEVKSISETNKNIKQANYNLDGVICSEYKRYKKYFEERSRSCYKEIVYYVLVGPCDRDYIIESLEEQRSWYWMKDRFKVVYLNELIDIFSDKIKEYNNKFLVS